MSYKKNTLVKVLKVSIKNGKLSSVEPGHSIVGELEADMMVSPRGLMVKGFRGSSLSTSNITQILETADGRLLVDTYTSTYLVEKV